MKGSRAMLGDENVSANGYRYVKTSTGWRLKHHLVAEETLGRPLSPDERVSFKDRNRENFDPKNIIVNVKMGTSNSGLNKRLTTIEERMIAFVEDSPNVVKAIGELYDVLDQICDVHSIEISRFAAL